MIRCNKVSKMIQKLRIRLYRYVYSSWWNSELKWAMVLQPVLIDGKGSVIIGESGGDTVILGWRSSPGFFDGSIYIEARYPGANVEIGAGTCINNNCTIIANTTSIKIGKGCRIGFGCSFFDSDFHHIHPLDRNVGDPSLQPDVKIEIGDNVFIGSNVIILKGVVVGAGSVIGAGSVVTKSIPPMTVAAGNPCRVIKEISDSDKLDASQGRSY